MDQQQPDHITLKPTEQERALGLVPVVPIERVPPGAAALAKAIRYTPTQAAVVDLVYGVTPEDLTWRGPCGHPGSSMTVDSSGMITCHVPVSQEHEHDDDGPECTRRCLVVKCGRTYTVRDVFTLDEHHLECWRSGHTLALGQDQRWRCACDLPS